MNASKRASAQRGDRYIIRFTSDGQRDQIKEMADRNHRSLNGQLLHLIEVGLKSEAQKQGGAQ